MVHALRNLTVFGAVLAGLAQMSCATQNTQAQNPGYYGDNSYSNGSYAADTQVAAGFWDTNFGAVKIEPNTKGGEGALMGVWVYDKNGSEVVGYFQGQLVDMTLEFSWREPQPQGFLTGSGAITFSRETPSFQGEWWTEAGDRSGQWSGTRPGSAQ